ncbi:serine/threonine-protein kinase ATR-like isoform X1 [Pomacea canaliculata]|uniref:serine/threonine-protein kinase ATR-like isoform X1 n=1 Tax=Pomacea canaliculata TaxID=400727 RepID=UPI000D72BBA9|nr:serine/threonine-protein kinase ATR-like isoform X1 [Pomacea canaliculata]
MSRNQQQIVRRLQKEAEKEQSIYWYRSAITYLVENFLSNLDAAAKSLHSLGHASECFSSLQLCEFFVGHNSEVFLHLASQPGNDETPNLSDLRGVELTKEEKNSNVFCNWLIQRLLRLLACQGCALLHPTCTSVLTHILLTIKVRSFYIFLRTSSMLIHCLADMVQISKQLYAAGNTGNFQLTKLNVNLENVRQSLLDPAKSPAEMQDFDNCLSELPFVLSSAEICELLQVNLSKLILTLIPSIGIFEPMLKSILYSTACCQLEFGDVDLKTVSLQMLVELMAEFGLPDLDNVQNYFLRCLTGQTSLLVSGCRDIKKEEITILEENTSSLINQLICTDGSLAAVAHHFSTASLHQMFCSVTSDLQAHGFIKVLTEKFRTSLAQLLCHILKRLPVVVLKGVCSQAFEQLFLTLFDHVAGQLEDLQFAAPLLVQILNVEKQINAKKCLMLPEVTSATQMIQTQQTPSSRLRRKRKEVAIQDGSKKMRSRMYHQLQAKVVDILDKGVNKDMCMTALAAGSLITDVAARLSGEIFQDKDVQRFADTEVYLDKDFVQRLSGYWRSILLTGIVSSLSSAAQDTAVLLIVRSAGCLLSSNDYVPITADLLQELTWMVSLPWLLNDPSWRDLRPSQVQEVSRISQEIADNINVNTMCQCLKVLASAPKEAAPMWRVHVFSQALNSLHEDVKTSAISEFPKLLLQLGPNAQHLISDLIHPLLQDPSNAVLRALAKAAGNLVCVAAGTVTLRRSEQQESTLPAMELSLLTCSKCLAREDETHELKQVDTRLFLPFLNLLKTANSDVRKDTVCSLKQMFMHMPVRSQSLSTVSLLTAGLSTVEDMDMDVRLQFLTVIPVILGGRTSTPDSENITSDTDKIIVEHLKTACTRATISANSGLHQTILITIGQLARYADGELLLAALIILLENRLSCIPLVADIAFQELQATASHKKVAPYQLFIKYRAPVCKFLVETMLDAQSVSGQGNAEKVLKTVSNTFGFSDIKAFIERCVKFLLPHLVSKASPEASSLIRLLANLLSITHRHKLIMNNIKYIFSHLVRFCPKVELEKALDYLQRETGFELGSLLRLDFQRVHNELLLYLSTSYSQVFNGLQMLSLNDEHYSGPKEITSAEEMAAYLEPRLLGVLAFFDSQLMNINTAAADKKLALESLISIIQLMGSKHITSIRHKVVNTLRLGLQFKDTSFVEISCRAWNCFVRSLELPILGQMLSQILATLLPLLLQIPQQVAEIINYMIVENRAELHDHFHEVYFLPDLPELADATSVLKMYTDSPSSQTDLKTRLVHCISGASHESVDVRNHALMKLRKLLRENQDSLFDLILGKESADPVVTRLVSVLLQGCRESATKNHDLYGQCLGELGALDPGRLTLMSNNPLEQHAKFQASVDDENFAVGLVNKIIKAFLAATEPKIQDCSAFALQELLQIYKIVDRLQGEKDSRGAKLWKRFPEQLQEILIPLLTSRYKLSTDMDWSNLPKPIYGSRKGNTYKDWVSNWTGYLVSKVKEKQARQVFEACSAAQRNDLQVALYLLPYEVVQVLLDGTEQDHLEIYNEMMEVVNQARQPDTRQSTALDLRHLSAQTTFSVIDYLTWWRTQRVLLLAARSSVPKGVVPYSGDEPYKAVNKFLCRIPQDTLAQASFNCKAYTRALMYFEQFITDTKQDLQEHLDFLQRLYDCLNEPDGVLGVAAIRQSQPTLMQEILAHESLGQQQDAQACYERALQIAPSELWPHQGLVRSLMEMGQLNKALLHTSGVLTKNPRWLHQLNQYRVEAAWKMCNWDTLNTMMKYENPGNNIWPLCIGRILMATKDRKEEEYQKHLHLARQEQMGPLSAASMEMGSYHRGYEYILRLHMLSELEDYFHVCHNFSASSSDSSEPLVQSSQEELLRQWNCRLQMVQSSFRTQEPILTLRRTLLCLDQNNPDIAVDKTIGRWWLWSAKVARKAGYLQTAYGCLLQASAFDMPEFFVEKAKWLWEKGENDTALSCLEKGIAQHFPSPAQFQQGPHSGDQSKRQVYGQALLLYGRYSEETSSMESNAILKRYRDVLDICHDWEDGHFYLAQYYDRLMTSIMPEKEKSGDLITAVVKYFGQALLFGNKFIYQAMPRLLSLWLDFGATVIEAEHKEKKEKNADKNKLQLQKLQVQKNILSKINALMCSLINDLAPYQFFTAFPQLVSRICHAHPEVSKILQGLIAHLLTCFPQQAMWMMMSVSKSSYTVRSQRCQEIFAAVKQKKPELEKLIQDATRLSERLLEVCEKDVGRTTTLSLSTNFKALKRLLDEPNFSEIMLPLQSAMTVTLPTVAGGQAGHNPFPDHLIYIKGIEDTIEILQSLARPKKITLVGSDGRLYAMMCKPKDDLRKDARLMEFNAIVNRFLYRDAESRRRQLHIRTYTVTPLNEECGIVEWVNNTSGFRHILVRLYREHGIHMSAAEQQSIMPAKTASLEVKMEIFKQKLLPRHPPIFREWFLRTFPDPTSWYNARVAYARTMGVMSMIGYILGLGDRHGENILFDSTTGDTVHVDFNCLFNRGETFEWPERVPFRLTQNMVSALGPMGCEGIFRRACEVTLRVVKAQTDPLMSVLKPFIYDPLVEWSKPTSRDRRLNQAAETGEITNEQALTCVQNIEDRLRGILKLKSKARGLPLSIEGHVKYLIQEATDEKNLCQMYIGWAAFY